MERGKITRESRAMEIIEERSGGEREGDERRGGEGAERGDASPVNMFTKVEQINKPSDWKLLT